MKFQCDRCKTRYSIADERVRGKILKIRCKNCEAVITVREGMEVGPEDAPAPAPAPAVKKAAPKGAQPKQPSKPALRGAFEKAMEKGPPRPPAPSPFDDDDKTAIADPPPPQQLQEEWYVSKDGDQFGPFELGEAQQWVAQRNPREELFCWTEGFDDWQSVDKVSHFRRSRRASTNPPPPPRNAGPPAVPTTRRSDTPKPLFASTMAAIEAEESGSVKRRVDDEASPGNGASARDDENDFDFDIGEASRVVNLSMLVPPAARRTGKQSAALPGMEGDAALGRGTGGYAHVQEVDQQGRQTGRSPVVVPLSDEALASARPDVLHGPDAGRRPGVQMWHVLAGVAGVAMLAIIMLAIALSGDDQRDPSRIVRSRIDGEGLGYRLDPRERKAAEAKAAEAKARGRDSTGGTRRVAGRGKPTRTTNPRGLNPFVKTDDFDFGDEDVGNQPLTPDDVMKVYQDRKLGVKLCYERALKKDPLLDVKKVYVNLSVAPSGVVTNVSMSSHGNTQLGQCLVSQIRRWKFRKSPETFSGRFPLVFRN